MALLLAIAFLLLLQPAFATPPQTNLNYLPADLTWTPMAIAALLVGIAFAALAFMAGEALSMPSIKAWVKGELYEHALSAFIILITIASIITLNYIVMGFLTPTPPGPQGALCTENLINPDFDNPNLYPVFTQAQYFLGCKVSPTDFIPWVGNFKGVMLAPMLKAYRHLIGIELLLGILSTMGFSTQQITAIVTVPRLSFQPLIGMTIVSEAHIMLLDYIAMGAGLIFSQKVLLQFIQEAVLTVFLPFGLLFRAIPLTRKTGSTIIAFCLAAYFVYPMSILLNAQIFQNITPIDFASYDNVLEICSRESGETDEDFELRVQTQVDGMKQAFEEVRDESQNPNTLNPASTGKPWNIIDRFSSSQEHYETSMWVKIKTAASAIWQFRTFILDPNVWSEFFYSYIIDEITPTMQILALNILFLVNSIILSITFFRDISVALGGEPRLFGISKLI